MPTYVQTATRELTESFTEARIDRSLLISFVACVFKLHKSFPFPVLHTSDGETDSAFLGFLTGRIFLFSIAIERAFFTIHYGRGNRHTGHWPGK
jgi:hypothetical protein